MKNNLSSKQLKLANLIDTLRYRAEQNPERQIYTFLENGEDKEVSITHSELDAQARTIAAHLQQKGMIGQRAVLIYAPSLEYLAGFFGCLYAGVIAVPAYPPDPTRLERTLPRLEAIIRDSQAKIVLTTEAIQSMGSFLGEQSALLRELKWFATDQLDLSEASAWKPPEIKGQDLAFLQYTSGSTGQPKGVMLCHDNLMANLGIIEHGFGVSAEDCGVSWLPPYHDMGLIGKLLIPLYSGLRTVFMSPLHFLQKPMRWIEAISRCSDTSGTVVSGGPNFAFEMCARKAKPEQLERYQLGHWKLAFNGAEPILPQTIKRFVETFGPCGFKEEAFYPCYGLAEGTLMVSGASRGRGVISQKLAKQDLRQNQVASEQGSEAELVTMIGSGKNFPEQKIVIARPEAMTLCPEGEIGEIWLHGPSVALGYWQKPEATRESFQAYLKDTQEGPFLRTGDLGFLKDGELFVTGRLKDLIIIRGENHYPQDIERSVEAAHQALRSGCSAAFSVRFDYEEKLVVAIEVEAKKLNNAEEEYPQIVQAIRKAVATEHELEVFAVSLLKKTGIPKTSSGKVRRRDTRQDFLQGRLDLVHEYRGNLQRRSTAIRPVVAESTGAPSEKKSEDRKSVELIQAWLLENIAEHLGMDKAELDVRENLATYGLDSKDAVNLSGDLEDWLGEKLSPTILWKYPTIEGLSQYLAGEDPLEATGS